MNSMQFYGGKKIKVVDLMEKEPTPRIAGYSDRPVDSYPKNVIEQRVHDKKLPLEMHLNVRPTVIKNTGTVVLRLCNTYTE